MNAYILTGGLSRRFGSDKAKASIYGASFTEHLFELLSKQFQSVKLVGKTPPFQHLPFVKDAIDSQCPLVGLYSGLSDTNAAWNFFLSVDTPLIQKNLIEFLKTRLTHEAGCVVAKTGQQIHPLCGFYHTSLIPKITQEINQKNYRMKDFLDKVKTRFVDVSKMEGQLLNINTVEDHKQMLKQIEEKKS